MKVAGVIAEFNPFHNGHKYLINKVKNEYADALVVVMSGSFVQRGGIALTDKWTRSKAAIMGGADLVLELPAVFAMNTAQRFATGAVEILNASGVVDFIAFGSESGNVDLMRRAALAVSEEPPEVSERIKFYSASGINYPAARKMAFEEVAGVVIPDSPNDILALEYLRALRDTSSDMDAKAIVRKGTDHDSDAVSENIASASEIRRRIEIGENASGFMPYYDFPVYRQYVLDAALIGKIRECGAEYIAGINDITEGLENRFIKGAYECSTVDELCEFVKSKRYTLSRIRRAAWSILLGFRKELCMQNPGYIRVLAMNKTGRGILKKMKSVSELPVIVKAADYENAKTDEIFKANVRAEDWFSLCAPDKKLRRGGRDITVSPVIMN